MKMPRMLDNAFRTSLGGKRYSVVPTQYGGFALMVGEEAQCFFGDAEEAKKHAESRHFTRTYEWDLAGRATMAPKPQGEAFVWTPFHSNEWGEKE